MGASIGMLGTVKVLAHLRDILFAGGLLSLEIYWKRSICRVVHTKMDEEGNITDEGTVAFLDRPAWNFKNNG